MEGIVSDQVMQYAGHPRNGEGARPRRLDSDPAAAAQPPAAPFAIMYAGQLHRDYGTQILLDAFAQLAPGDGPFQLWICGRGTMESHVRRAAAADPRITYHGFVDDDALFTAMARASVLVNPRPFDPAVSPYSFPSKLLEYMAMGKIVICAKLPGIPPEYYPHLVLVDNMTPCALARQIRQVATWSPQRRCDMARRAAQFVFSSKTQLHQGRRIVDFLGSLGERTTRLGSG
jgi:glycosyltransferase involved in cell wall biosynthesis